MTHLATLGLRPSGKNARSDPSAARAHFAGADRKRKAIKWRCPTGECKPASVWIKADRLHPLIQRETLRLRGLYRRRASVERAFGRLKHEWALTPLRVRRLERVQLHADLAVLSPLSSALVQSSAIALAV